MPTYKLMYFNGRGYGEVARMMFALKGVDFEDFRFTREEWPTHKADKTKFPLGQAPVLLVDGVPIPHSSAINRHLAREFGFYGKSNEDKAKIDIICETIKDLGSKLLPIYFEQDETKKAEIVKEFKENSSKPFFNFLQDLIRKAGGKYFVGDSLTLADLIVFAAVDGLLINKTTIEGLIEPYEDLMKFYKGIKEDSPLKPYLESRPKTDF